MTAIAIFNGLFCDARPVVEHVAEITGYRLVDDHEIITEAARLSGLDRALFTGMFNTKSGISSLNEPDRNRLVGWLRHAMARVLAGEKNSVFWGYTALLAPRDCENILSVCLVNERNDRLWAACRDGRYTQGEAMERMANDDRLRGHWVVGVTDCNDPWSEALYDMVIPVAALGVRQSAYLIVEQLANGSIRDTEVSRARIEDFCLAAKVQTELARTGQDIAVSANNGALTLSLESHDATLKGMAQTLMENVSEFEGVRGVEVGTGMRYDPNDVFQRVPFAHERLSEAAVEDAECLSACVEDTALAGWIRSQFPYREWGVSVFVRDGFVSLTINDHSKLVAQMGRRVCDLAAGLDGVSSVTFGIGRDYHQGAACDRIRRDMCRAFLAEEKRKFLPTLSPRLQRAGRVGTFALYDGRSAFYTMDEHEPEVVVLDMPGTDGTDVLRRFKRDHPGTEVLVLSDREAEQDREACMNLGAFACLKKPVNTAALSETVRAAREKYRACVCS